MPDFDNYTIIMTTKAIIEVKTLAEYKQAYINLHHHKAKMLREGKKCKIYANGINEHRLCNYCIEQEGYLYEYEQLTADKWEGIL